MGVSARAGATDAVVDRSLVLCSCALQGLAGQGGTWPKWDNLSPSVQGPVESRPGRRDARSRYDARRAPDGSPSAASGAGAAPSVSLRIRLSALSAWGLWIALNSHGQIRDQNAAMPQKTHAP